MREIKRIPIILDKINWDLFINQHLKLTDKSFDILKTKIISNLEKIKNHWLKYSDLRLGQLLINEGYLPDNSSLWNVEETKWLVDNKLCNFEDINFWGKTRDKYGNKLPETKKILLKDLDNAHISAILDWCDEHNIKLNSNYKEYFENRILNIKIKNNKY
jgi:hypothetical protein